MMYLRSPIMAVIASGLLFSLSGCQTAPHSKTGTDPLPAEAPLSAAGQQLKQIESMVQQGQLQESLLQLKQLRQQPLGLTESAQATLLQAQILRQQRQYAAALKLLVNPPESLPATQAKAWLELRSQLAIAQGEWLAAARDTLALLPLSPDSEKSQRYPQLWQQLQGAKTAELKQAIKQQDEDNELMGWLELAYLSRSQHQADSLKRELRRWAQRYPQHPASQQLPPDLAWVRDLNWQIPSQIGIILPMSGPTSAAVKPVIDGLNAARQHSGHKNRVMLYDSYQKDIVQLYEEAARDGNQVIVGPLEKEQVNQLATWGKLTKPTLALNYAQEDLMPPGMLYQFSLAPEDELMQIAEQAWQENHRKVMLLLPKNAYGQRVNQAFSQIWQSYGGQVSDITEYQNANDLPKLLRQHLKIADGEQRQAAVQQQLGKKVLGHPTPRPDVDLILMAGTRPEARQLKSILTSLYAQHIPIWGTSRLNDGPRNPGMDQELNGIRLTDAPWMLDDFFQDERSKLIGTWPKYQAGAARLFAFGYDAYQLLPILPILRQQPDYQLNGLSGSLLMDSRQHIQRRLVWSQYQKGRVSPSNRLDNLNNKP
jgi:outer membrane PBP1 activator LpoA protein